MSERSRTARLGALLMMVLSGCSTETPAVDAAVDAPPDAGATRAAPADPVLTPCPSGWLEVASAHGALCEPTPASAAPCEPGALRLPGASACEPVDDLCGARDFPLGAIFVRAGATGGDGTEALPFGSLLDALARGGPGATIALADGSYDAPGSLPDAVTILGACAARVILHGAAGSAAIGIASGHGAVLEGVTITGDDVGIFTRGALTLRRVEIRGTTTAAIAVRGSLDAERLLVIGTRTGGGVLGRAIDAEGAETVRLRDVVLEGSHDAGIAIVGSVAVLDAERIAIRDTRPNDAGRFGTGIAAFEGATVLLSESAIEGASESGLIVDGSTATLRDVVVRDVVSEPSLANGHGLFARSGVVTLTRVRFERVTRAAVAAYAASRVEISDLVVDEVRPDFEAGHAAGIGASSGATVTADRIWLRATQHIAVLAVGASDSGSATEVQLRDARIDDVVLHADLGMGFVTGAGGHIRAERFVIEHGHVVGAMAVGVGSELTLTNGTVSDMAEGELYDRGRGVEIDEGAQGTLVDVEISGARETAVVAYGAGTRLSLTDVHVRGIAERACAASTCAAESGGSGVVAVYGGAIDATGLRVEGAPLCGVQVAEGGSLDVHSGSISSSAIGACVQVEGYDVARVVDGVVYRDNESNVDSGGAYVPPASASPVGF